jgi:hypothetical protein
MLITDDNRLIAGGISEEFGLDESFAAALPRDKAEKEMISMLSFWPGVFSRSGKMLKSNNLY